MTQRGPAGRFARLRDRRAIVRRRRSATWQIMIAVLVATVGAVGLGYLAVQLVYLPETLAQARTGRVPDLTGMEVDDARASGESQGYAVVESGWRHAEDVTVGEVIYQIPPPDFYLPQGDTVRLLVSRGPVRTVMPDLAGLEPPLAESIVRRLGLSPTPTRRAPSDLHPQGTVVETVPPADTPVPEGTRVTLVLSRGGSILTMPEVRGLTLAAARDSLEVYSLTVGEVNNVAGRPMTVEGSEGSVVVSGQDPPPGRNVRAGSAVKLELGERTGPARDAAPVKQIGRQTRPPETKAPPRPADARLADEPPRPAPSVEPPAEPAEEGPADQPSEEPPPDEDVPF